MTAGVDYLRSRIRDANIAFIQDPIEDYGFKILRSLPAIHYLGIRNFTFPKSWRQLSSPRQYDYLNYEYELLGDIELDDLHLCSITNQYYEDETHFTIRPLLAQYKLKEETLVVVADERSFYPQEGQRPLKHQQFVDEIGEYVPKIYKPYQEYYQKVGVGCPLNDTANLFMQDNANMYRMVTGEPLSKTKELFEVLPEAPYLPLYESFVDIFGQDKKPGSTPLDSYAEIQGFGRWLRRRINWDRNEALSVARYLNRQVDEDGSVFDSTQKEVNSNMKQARETAKSIDPQESHVHRRYVTWLNGGSV